MVGLIDFIQRIAVREDLARIDLTVKNRLQQDFLVIGRHRSRTAGKRDVSVERFRRIHPFAMRQADATDEAAGTNDAECLVSRALSTDAFEDGIVTVAARQFENLLDAFRSAFSHDVGCARFERHLLAVFVTAHDDDLRSSEHLGGDHRTLTDGTVTDDDDLVAWFDACDFSGVVAGCHDVGQRQQGFEHPFAVVVRRTRHFDQSPVGVLLCADAEIIVMIDANAVKACQTCGTVPAAVRERHDDEIARLASRHAFSDFFHDADCLVSVVDRVLLLAVAGGICPKVGAANARSNDTNDRIVCFLNLWLVQIDNAHLACLFVICCFHQSQLAFMF